MEGRWISAAEAKEKAVGNEEWWKTKGIGGRTVELKQYLPGGPRDKPIKLWEDGNMYLGEWKANGANGRPVKHGFGIYYCNKRHLYKGAVHIAVHIRGALYIGNRKNGKLNGRGKELWLESSLEWRKNENLGSWIKEEMDGKMIGRPFVYEGNYVDGKRHDPHAKVTLKDGTCRVGPWEAGKPVGDWWSDADHPRAATAAAARASLQQDVDTEETRPTKRSKREPAEQEEESKPAAVQDPPLQAPNGEADDSDGDSTVELQPDAPPPSSVDIVALGEGNDRVQSIATWLTETIGHNPDPEAVQTYATTFFQIGFDSVELIAHECTAQDWDSFGWIKPVHRRILKRKLKRDED